MDRVSHHTWMFIKSRDQTAGIPASSRESMVVCVATLPDCSALIVVLVKTSKPTARRIASKIVNDLGGRNERCPYR